MKSGFTLIELMVVIGIAVLLTIGSILGISNSQTKRKVKTTAEKLKYVISEAVSQAKSPDDTTFGLVKIEIDVYHLNSNSTTKNQVKVYNCFSTDSPCTNRAENTKLSFESPNGVYLDAKIAPPQGNMSRFPTSGQIDYYYFSVCASKSCTHVGSGGSTTYVSKLGQLSNYNKNVPPTEDKVFLKVMETSNGVGGDIYDVAAYINSGLVVSTKE